MVGNDDWLKKSVSQGLQALLVLHLEGGPGCDTIVETAQVWVMVIKRWPIDWNEAADRQRLEQGFLLLASQCNRWPSPNQLRTVLPARKPAPSQLLLDYPPEKAAKNRRRLREIIAGLGEVWDAKGEDERCQAQADLQTLLTDTDGPHVDR